MHSSRNPASGPQPPSQLRENKSHTLALSYDSKGTSDYFNFRRFGTKVPFSTHPSLLKSDCLLMLQDLQSTNTLSSYILLIGVIFPDCPQDNVWLCGFYFHISEYKSPWGPCWGRKHLQRGYPRAVVGLMSSTK